MDTVKVFHEHVIFAPLLAPQTPPEDIVAKINQIYKLKKEKTEGKDQEVFGTGPQGLPDGFFVKYREGVKVSSEHQTLAPVLAPIDTQKVFPKSAPPQILKGLLEGMVGQTGTAARAKVKVSNEHKTTLSGLAPQDTYKGRLDKELMSSSWKCHQTETRDPSVLLQAKSQGQAQKPIE